MPAFGTGLVALICYTALGMLLFTFKAHREGSYHRGPGWYLDLTDRSEGPLPAYRSQPRSLYVPPRLIGFWAAMGVALIGAAVLTWTLLDIPGLAIAIGVFAVVYVGGA